MVCCNKCDKAVGGYLLTALGEPMCEDCWDEYICTQEGKVEYILGIARGDYPASEFDEDFLKSAAKSWTDQKESIRAVIPAKLWAIADTMTHAFNKR